MKKTITLITLLATLLPAVAQQVEFRYNGKTLPDNATVTILAESDEWGSTSCATNPGNNTSLLTLYNVADDMSLTGTATINIEENTINAPQVSWCMGGQCINYDATAGKTHQKAFAFDNFGVQTRDLRLDYDLLMLENYQHGTMRTKLTVAVGGETRTVNIVFLYGGTDYRQVWWGYHHDSDGLGGLGTQTAETYDQAILVKGSNPAVKGKSIKQVKFYLQKLSTMSDVKVWISKTLPSDVNRCDYTQPIAMSALKGNAQGEEITLTTPWTATGEDFYVGYSYTITTVADNADAYPIIIGGNGAEGSCYLRTSKSVTSWSDSHSYGNLALHLLLEGDFVQNAISADNFGEKAVLLGDSREIPVTITSNGTAAVSNISYTITTDGTTTEEQTVNVSPTLTGMGSTATVNIPFAADGELGTRTKVLTITKVNGETNAADLPFATGTVKTADELKEFQRNVLIEEFTTEYCVYCPQAATTLNSTMNSYPNLKERTAIVCHHAGYYTDWLTIPAGTSYTWFYNEGGSTYAPAFMWDRYPYASYTPVESRPASVAACKARIEDRLAVAANASLGLTAQLSADKTKVEVTADTERGINFCDTPARITLILTEDNITARSQSGASGTFIHQHVARAVNSTWGAVLDWQDDKARYTYTFDLNPAWKLDDLKVVGFISGYDSTNPTNCIVENAASINIAETDAITAATDGGQLKERSRYNAAGQQLTTPQRGINVVKLSDGRTVKVLVK